MRFGVFNKLHSIIDWVQVKFSPKQFIIFSSILVGLSVGLAAVVLKTFVHYIFQIATYDKWANNKYFFFFLPIIGIFLTVWIIQRFFKGKLEKGLAQIHLAISKKNSVVPKEQMYAQIVTSSATVGFGGSAGLEAPIVITGAAFGTNYAETYNLNTKERTLLLACGIAAGIAATFNAPIAGVLFALEVLLIDISIAAFTPIIIAAATGALTSKVILQNNVLLSLQSQEVFSYTHLPFYLFLGLLGGIVSVYHSRMFTKIEGFFSKSTSKVYWNVVIGGLLLATLFTLFPPLFGEGFQSIMILSSMHPENLLDNSFFIEYKNNGWYVIAFVGVVMFVKAIATGLTLGSGGNGGNFAPALFVGSYLGFVVSKAVNMLNIIKLPVSNFTIVGMAGILSGLYHAPLTAIFLIAEITGGYNLMIPLMIVSSTSFAISKYFDKYSMDTKKLGESGKIFTDDRDHNILTTISTSNLIETNFKSVNSSFNLGQLVKIISISKRNLFPVVDNENILKGVIVLDNIRDKIFNTELYDSIFVTDLMIKPTHLIQKDDNMEVVMAYFDKSGAWNLPVVENGKYVGFISKSSIFTSYRTKLKSNTIT